MYAFLGIVGMLGVFITLILFIIFLCTKQPKRTVLILMGCFFLLSFIGFAISPDAEEILQDGVASTTTKEPKGTTTHAIVTTTPREEQTTTQPSEEQIAAQIEEYKKSAKAVTYKDLLREPKKYEGETLIVTIEISQLMVGGFFAESGYRGYDDKNEWYIGYKISDDVPRILEDDMVIFYGEFEGLREIKRALTGVADYVPVINAKYHEIIEE